MADFFDSLETRDPGDREAAQMSALPDAVANAKTKTAYFNKLFDHVDPQMLDRRDTLAELPVTRKSDLVTLQAESPPFGGVAAHPAGSAAMIYASPGPIYEPEFERSDYWRIGRAIYAAGFRSGDIVHNTFAYHLTPGGWMLHSGARAVGCAVVPAGVGNTEQQLNAIAHLQPKGYMGVPDFLSALIEKADETGVDISCIQRGMVSGAALFPKQRAAFRERGITVRQCYATADLGLIGYESEAEEGLILDEGVILEIVRPGTGDPVAPGEVGEVVITTLNPDYPLIRFGTGDLSAILEGPSPCGRTNTRIKGWMGRADQTTKVKGMFVHPGQVAEILKRHPDVKRGRLVVSRAGDADVMTLRCEVEEMGDGSLSDKIAETLQSVTKLRGAAELVSPGALANDGKVIDDTRSYD
ncbi:MAG: AMP-binding protein [Pseudomonadota bacterium]